MEEKLKALYEDLMAQAFDPGTQKYNIRDTHKVIKDHWDKLSKDQNQHEGKGTE